MKISPQRARLHLDDHLAAIANFKETHLRNVQTAEILVLGIKRNPRAVCDEITCNIALQNLNIRLAIVALPARKARQSELR